jgi:hypothetical protein
VIRIEFRPDLHVSRGKLRSGGDAGTAVHAGSFLRDGLIVLDSGLKRRPRELRRILIHELFHFIWWRLGNPRRREWQELLAREIALGSRGELGWSAEIRKRSLTALDRMNRTRPWREYCCESFCDSGATIYCGNHGERTLAARHERVRRKWMEAIIANEAHIVELIFLAHDWSGRLPVGLDRLFRLAHGPRGLSESPSGT